MTLKIYVAKDSVGRVRAPDTSHEVRAIEWMLEKAWLEFNHLQETYAIIVNLRHPSADMVVLTERGIGLLELKHKYGEIKVNSDGTWMAGISVIRAGKHRNPREQVRSYTRELRKKILRWILPTYVYANKDRWSMLKFQTGVCFTHPDADIREMQKYVSEKHIVLDAWESNFSIIDIGGFTAWIRELRFQLQHDYEYSKDFEHVRLSPDAIVKIASDILDNVEWDEIYAAMPDGNPYAYLILENTKNRQVLKLVKDRSIVGRSPDCDVVIPGQYTRVSKKHCAIIRKITYIEIVDIESTNGTFINYQPIRNSARLQHENIILLGGCTAHEKNCIMRFEIREQILLDTPATEVSAYIVQKDDTLETIANKFGSTIEMLLLINPSIKSQDPIHVGQLIQVK